MARRISRIALLVTGFAVVGLIGFAAGGFAGVGHGFGAPGMRLALAGLVESLDLDQAQQQRLDAVHRIMLDHVEDAVDGRAQHRQWLAERVRQGDLDQAEVRQLIDQHLDDARVLAYQLTDQLVPLLNSLDETQRATLMEFMEQAHGLMQAHGWGGPLGPTAHGSEPR